MNISHEKLTDLQRLSEEIIRQPLEKALPCNLSDEWLHLLERDFRIALRNDDLDLVGDPLDYMKAPLTLISHLAVGKNNGAWAAIDEDKLFRYFLLYQAEILLEIARRNGSVDSPPATMETIFTEREIYLLRPSRGFACEGFKS